MPNRCGALGRAGEDAAAAFLQARGWDVVGRNVRVREGEIDLVARRAGTVAFVEVKTRRTRTFGTPAEAVTYRKRVKIRAVARAMLAAGVAGAREVRFDVIEVTAEPDGSLALRHIEGAF